MFELNNLRHPKPLNFQFLVFSVKVAKRLFQSHCISFHGTHLYYLAIGQPPVHLDIVIKYVVKLVWQQEIQSHSNHNAYIAYKITSRYENTCNDNNTTFPTHPHRHWTWGRFLLSTIIIGKKLHICYRNSISNQQYLWIATVYRYGFTGLGMFKL